MALLKVMRTVMALCFVSGLCGQEADTAREERFRVESSPLHQRAVAASGQLYTVGNANPSNLYGSLQALMNASDLVILGHINGNSSELCPSGTAPMTVYEVGIIQTYKGVEPEPTVHVSLPTGMVVFADGSRASASVKGFLPLENGERYVLFLRSARGAERQITPGLRLAGDGVQGAFLLDDETVRPNFREDAFWRAYFSMPVPAFLSQVASLSAK
jgi:hypothetical protein